MRHQPIEPMNPTSDPTPEGLAAAAVSSAVPATAATDSPEGLQTVAAQLVRELVRERRTERRWRIFFRLAWFGLFVAIVWAIAVGRGQATGSSVSGPHTALVEVRGEIAADSEANAEDIVSALRSAFEDDGAQAVVLRINSPGGSPVQAGIVYDEIKRLKALHKKRVYAVVEDVCASGAYYIAVGADEIFVDKASIVGSIGVLMDGFGFTGLMDKLGVERRLITAGSNKGMLDPFSPQNEAQKAMAQAMIDQVHQQFIHVVKEGRGNRLKEQADTFSGLFWNGEESIKLGLADKFGNLDFVAREVVKAEEVVNYTPQENVAERLAKRFGAAIGAGAARALVALPALR
jgi:protease IV